MLAILIYVSNLMFTLSFLKYLTLGSTYFYLPHLCKAISRVIDCLAYRIEN